MDARTIVHSVAELDKKSKQYAGEPRGRRARFAYYDAIMRRNQSVVGRGGEPSKLDFGVALKELITANDEVTGQPKVFTSLASPERGRGIGLLGGDHPPQSSAPLKHNRIDRYESTE